MMPHILQEHMREKRLEYAGEKKAPRASPRVPRKLRFACSAMLQTTKSPLRLPLRSLDQYKMTSRLCPDRKASCGCLIRPDGADKGLSGVEIPSCPLRPAENGINQRQASACRWFASKGGCAAFFELSNYLSAIPNGESCLLSGFSGILLLQQPFPARQNEEFPKSFLPLFLSGKECQ